MILRAVVDVDLILFSSPLHVSFGSTFNLMNARPHFSMTRVLSLR